MKKIEKTNYPIVFLALFLNLFAGGVVFGWGALVVKLQQQGVYSSYCKSTSELVSPSNITSTASSTNNEICAEQQLRLNAVFLLGTFGSMSMSFPSGFFMDKTSSKLTVITAVLLQMFGSVLFSISSETLDLFSVGYFLMGSAGPFALLGGVTITASNVEEKRKGLYISILNGCYDASAIVWQIYVWLDSSIENGISYRVWFLIYFVFNLLLLVSILVLLPGSLLQHSDDDAMESESQESNGKNNISKTLELTGIQEAKSIKLVVEDDEDEKNVDEVNVKNKNKTTIIALPDRPLLKQLQSLEFVVFCIFFCVGLLRFSYYIGSIDAQLSWLGQENGNYSIIFGAILPFGIFSTPFIGMLIDSKGFKSAFVVIYFFKFLHSVLVMIPNLDVQIGGFICFAIFRGCFFATCGAYLIETFGLKMGKIFGVAATIASLTSLSQSALLALSLSINDFIPSNLIVLGLTCCVCLLHLWYFNCRKEPTSDSIVK